MSEIMFRTNTPRDDARIAQVEAEIRADQERQQRKRAEAASWDVDAALRQYQAAQGKGRDTAHFGSGPETCLDACKEKAAMEQAATMKAANPKDAVGVRKVPIFSVIPWGVISEIALALLEGARKYGRHNYRVSGVRASVYVDALGRHIGSWVEGEDIDAESGLNHITKALATLTVLRDSMMTGNWIDDRPPSTLGNTWVQDANRKASEIINRIPDAKPPFTQLDLGKDWPVERGQ